MLNNKKEFVEVRPKKHMCWNYFFIPYYFLEKLKLGHTTCNQGKADLYTDSMFGQKFAKYKGNQKRLKNRV